VNNLIFPIVAIVIFALIFSSARFIKPFEKDGYKVFRPNIIIGIVGGVSLAFCLFVIFIFAFQIFYMQLQEALVIGGLFAVLGTPLFILQFTVRIYVNDTSIIYRNFFGKQKQINFNEIESIKRSLGGGNEFIIKSTDNKKIRVSPLYSGYLNIMQIVRNNTSFSIDILPNKLGF